MAFMDTPVELEMLDGRVRLSLRMRSLYVVWRKWPPIWSEFSRIANSEVRDARDVALVLYAAYVCECIDSNTPPRYGGGFEEFEAMLPDDAAKVLDALDGVYSMKSDWSFKAAFEKRTHADGSEIKLPPLTLADPMDFYTFYVDMMGVGESVFWDAELAFVQALAANSAAYEAWRASEMRKAL